jgi:hypothetical protein
MISLFSTTFKAPYFEYLVRSSTQHFTDLVVIAERIEKVIELCKIVNSIEEKGFTGKKKELRFTISKVVTKAREKTIKTKTPTPSIANFSILIPEINFLEDKATVSLSQIMLYI